MFSIKRLPQLLSATLVMVIPCIVKLFSDESKYSSGPKTFVGVLPLIRPPNRLDGINRRITSPRMEAGFLSTTLLARSVTSIIFQLPSSSAGAKSSAALSQESNIMQTPITRLTAYFITIIYCMTTVTLYTMQEVRKDQLVLFVLLFRLFGLPLFSQ